MSLFARTFVVTVVLASLCSCAAMEENYRETYCNYDGSYRRGYNDARYYRPMDVYESSSCLPEQKVAADRGYADGYRAAVAARSGVVIVPAQPVMAAPPAGYPAAPPQGYPASPPPGYTPPAGSPPPGYAGTPPPPPSGTPPPPPPGVASPTGATPPPGMAPPAAGTSAYPPPPPGQGGHSVPTQASCTVNADCPINTFCKNRGDGQSQCLGDGVPGQYCTSSDDCQHGLTCRPYGGMLSTCQ
jgi:hypothetical protein